MPKSVELGQQRDLCHVDAGEAALYTDFVHVQAGLHYRAGRIQQLHADQAGAREHYLTAQRIEPNGSYGQLAAQALQAITLE